MHTSPVRCAHKEESARRYRERPPLARPIASSEAAGPARPASAPPRFAGAGARPAPRDGANPNDEDDMDRGQDFLKSQINNSVMQHQTFLKNLEDHEGQAEDPRFRDLCSRFIPHVREHQRMLEQYQQCDRRRDRRRQEGARRRARHGARSRRRGPRERLPAPRRRHRHLAPVAGHVLHVPRGRSRARRRAPAAASARRAQKHHEEYAREANRLAEQFFVEHARGTDPTMSTAQTPADTLTPRTTHVESGVGAVHAGRHERTARVAPGAPVPLLLRA